MESSYQRKEKTHAKKMCKHCKSTAHSTLQHHKHYKEFRSEMKEKRMAKHMKTMSGLSEEKETPEQKETTEHRKSAPKGHAPKGPHGRAAVHALGRTKTTGNFARIEAKSGKGAAINAYQNALSAHKAGK